MKVIREVRAAHRPGRGRFWGAYNEGYTADLAQAGLYDAGTLPAHLEGLSSEIPAVSMLGQEISRLQIRLRALEALLALAAE